MYGWSAGSELYVQESPSVHEACVSCSVSFHTKTLMAQSLYRTTSSHHYRLSGLLLYLNPRPLPGAAEIVVEIAQEESEQPHGPAPPSPATTDSPLARGIKGLNRGGRSQNGARVRPEDPHLGVLEEPRAVPTDSAVSTGETKPQGAVPRRKRGALRSGKRSNYVSASPPVTNTPTVCF